MRSLSSRIAVLASLITLSACGSSDLGSELPSSFNGPAYSPAAPSAADQQVQEAIPQILSGIQDIQQELRTIRSSGPRSAAQPAFSQAAPPTATAPTPADIAAPTPATPTAPSAPQSAAAAAPTAPAAAPAAPKRPDGTAELMKILDKVRNAPYLLAQVTKIERNGQDGSSLSTTGIKMTMTSPNKVLAEITKSSKSPDMVGTRILYTSGQGDKAKVRPSGGLSFITTDLDKQDERLTSTNNYTPDQYDMVGLHSRLSQGYKAELVGRTSLGGAKVNVLRVTTTGTNSMGSFVTHEHIGYEPDTYKLRLWEMYNGSKTPFYRMIIDSMEFPSSLPGDAMKL